MNLLARIWQSSLGKKYLMAVTGGILVLFVIGHMLGNLQIFLGREQLNAYGFKLQSLPALLWIARLVLLATVGLHIVSAVQLSRENAAARPVPYARIEYVASTYASRTMLMSGLIVAAFILYHILHFTVQTPSLNLTGRSFLDLKDPAGHHDIYAMVVIGFRQPLVSAFYILGMVLLSLHLRHGIASMFQSLGVKTAGNHRFFEVLAWTLALAILIGNCLIPIAILCGFGKDVPV